MRVEVLPITQARIGVLKKSGSVGKCGTGALAGHRQTLWPTILFLGVRPFEGRYMWIVKKRAAEKTAWLQQATLR